MVEPFAAVVFNKLLSSSSTLRYSSSLNSVARVMTSTSSRNSVGPDFFSPQPRRVKGKDKLVDTSDGACHLSQCQEWSSCMRRHSLWCPYQSRFMMLEELSQSQRSTRRHKSRPQLTRRSLSGSLFAPAAYDQRRHASNASKGASTTQHEAPPHRDPDALDASSMSPDTYSTLSSQRWSASLLPFQEFERVIGTNRAKLDMGEAWKAYEGVESLDLPLSSKLAFVDKYLCAAELHYRRKTTDAQLHEWGHRANSVLNPLSRRMPTHARFSRWGLCLQARVMALLGDSEAATQALHAAHNIPISMLYSHQSGITYSYETVISSLSRYKSNAHAIEFITEEWSNISSHLNFQESESHFASQEQVGRSLRIVAYRIAAEVADPSPFLERDEWDKNRRATIGCFFIDALCSAKMAREAHEVLLKMRKLGLHVPSSHQLTLVRFLSRQSSFVRSAVKIYTSIPAEHRSLAYVQTGLHVHSRQGNTEVAQKFFDDILAIGPPTPSDVAVLIHSYAVADNTDKAKALFDEFYPLNLEGKRMNSPRLVHYTAMLYAHSRKGDQSGITYWLKDLANADLVPNDYVFTIVLNAFAHAGDVDSVMVILEQMREAGIQPNAVTYTIVITLLAHRKDAIGAEAIFKRALRESVVPDNRMIVAMMNAHVEAGSWKGVIRAYDYLIASRIHSLSIDVYNTLMKAYVLIGAPFAVVYKFFKRLERSKSEPDTYTYSLLVQSACDSGLMDIASDIYYDMEQLSQEQLDRDLNINVYILTILMAGFLQHGDKVRAKAVYDEMRDKGIQPTPITFGTIIKAYGNEKSKESLRIAEEFIKSLVAVPDSERVWLKPKYDSKTALHHLYGPVISAYSKMQKPEEVERVFREMTEEGAPPSLGTLSALLDVHRRTFNIDAVLEIWPQIYEMGMELTNRHWLTEAEDTDEVRGIRGNVLCVPLSIYIDALSAAGRHSEIAAVWKDFRSRGFSFDSHNWNHLVVALVRAGEPERAFEVLEKVVIPFQELSARSKQPRDRNPSSPLISDLHTKREDGIIDETPGEPPMHRREWRVVAAKIATARTARMPDWEEEENLDDFAHHLHILHQISPSWATWRPHNAALTVLLTSLNRLSAGTLVKPVVFDGGDMDPDEDERQEAREILNRIYSTYPKTVSAVLNYETWEKQRLGSDYDEEYNWG